MAKELKWLKELQRYKVNPPRLQTRIGGLWSVADDLEIAFL
jgi:hypothetical protein